MTYDGVISLLGEHAEELLNYSCSRIPKESIKHPSRDHVAVVFGNSDRNKEVQRNLQKLFSHGRLGNSGYLSVFPVDQGVEHTAGYSFANNPLYFDPENVVKLAVEAGSSAVASTVGILGLVSKKFASKIPFIVKLNHNELLTYPNKHDQIMFAQVQQAFDLGAKGVGATIYFGSKESNKQIIEVAKTFYEAHKLGMFTVLWCYTRNKAFKTHGENHQRAADITGQANYLGVTLEADIIKQKFPITNYGFQDLDFAKHSPKMYRLIGNHPIDLVRYQVANCYMGKISLLNSGGASKGSDDLKEAILTAVINKRGGGSGMIMGRKIFNRSFEQGIELIQNVQDVYLEDKITVA
jgi:fructose-bisphosphate aldolase, class I